MRVFLLNPQSEVEKHIEFCARICYDSNDKTKKEVNEKLLLNLIKNGHMSVFEHISFTFHIDNISRACSHQLVRHRLASFSQRSQRYVKENNFDFITPESVKENVDTLNMFNIAIKHINNSYKMLCDLGINKEDARFLLPNAASTELAMTCNLREWLHIIDLRVSKHAQWEIRELLIKIWRMLYLQANNIFNLTYFEYNSKDYDYKKEIYEKYIKI